MTTATVHARAHKTQVDLRAPIVLMTGGKGGVGKTTLAANTAFALARRGRRVLLVDLDLGLADAHVLLRITPPRTLEDALMGRCTFADCIVRTEAGLDVLAAGSGTPQMGQLGDELRTRLCNGLRELARNYDIVVADGAAGIGPDVLAFCALADHVLVVTTPEPMAITDAYGLIKALHAHGEEAQRDVATPELVINRASGLEEAEATAARLRLVCERFLSRSPRNAGWMPASGAVEIAARFQRPFALDPRATLAHTCLDALAARLSRLGAVPEKSSAGSKSFMILPDRSPARSLARVWLAVGRRLAVAAGASTALVCLLCHNSLLTASLRGALALVAASIVVRIGHAALSNMPVRQIVTPPRGAAQRK